jgi:CHRD domain
MCTTMFHDQERRGSAAAQRRKGFLVSKKGFTTAGVVALVASALVATAQARTASTGAVSAKTYVLKATLDARHEIPRPKGASAARGVFTAKLTVAGKKSSFVWQLTFSHLTGRATAAHVHYGVAGKAGVVALPLCGPCKPSAHGAYTGPYVSKAAFLDAVLHGKTYVNVHTKKNPKGEIRGQLKVTSS